MSHVVIGVDAETGEKVIIEQKISLASTYIAAVPGAGKSAVMDNMALQNANQGHGLMMMDAHGTTNDDFIRRCPRHRLKDIIFLNLKNPTHVFGLNPVECANPNDPYEIQKKVSVMLTVMQVLFAAGRAETPRIMQYIRNFTYLLAKNQLTLYEMVRLFVDDMYRQKCLQQVSDPLVRGFFIEYEKMSVKDRKEDRSSTYNKIEELLSPITRNILGQQHTTINLREIMDQRKILLITLDAETNDILTLMGALFLSELLRAAYSRIPNKKGEYAHFAVFLDEFPKYATHHFSLLISEVRKFGIAMCYANQSFQQKGMDEVLLSTALQASTKIIGRISGQDADTIIDEFQFKLPPPVIVGSRPIFSIVQDPVDHLVKNGHKNPLHAAFVQEYLRPTKALVKFYDEPMLRGYKIRVSTWQESGGEFALGALFAVVGGATGKGGPVGPPVPYIDSPLAELQTLLYQVQQTRNPELNIPAEIIRGFSNCGNSGFYRLVYEKLKGEDVAYLGCGGAPLEDRLSIIKWRVPYPTSAQQSEINQLIHFLQTIRQMMRILAEEPIMGSSGQHEPVYGPARTYQDVANEQKQKLANLPNFTAFTKLSGAKENFVIIKTLSPDELFPLQPVKKPDGTVIKPNPQRLLQDRLEEITTNNIKDGYLRPVKEVEAEIATRWNDDPPTPPRKTLI